MTTDIRLLQLPRGGVVLASIEGYINSIATDGTTVFWAEDSAGVDATSATARVQSVPVAGGPASVLLDNRPNPVSLTIVGDRLLWGETGSGGIGFFSNDAGSWTMPKSGGAPLQLAGPFSALQSFAADGSGFAWAQWTDTQGDWALMSRTR
jgi:hypothetical protein